MEAKYKHEREATKERSELVAKIFELISENVRFIESSSFKKNYDKMDEFEIVLKNESNINGETQKET